MTAPATCARASSTRTRQAVRPITSPSAAPTCSAGASAGTVTGCPSAAQVLRGLTYSTGAWGGAL
ncbi:MAG: hypothetical protein A3E25_15830 [Burkholderiales bacterium RIFCSPHIGHO2_12_FULL_69_20]|nr:MAG: hypothetical protein A3E25_15830 [Burkholderiales bacterium RIFCSPHIGHO2_12_FULL_69_20]